MRGQHFDRRKGWCLALGARHHRYGRFGTVRKIRPGIARFFCSYAGHVWKHGNLSPDAGSSISTGERTGCALRRIRRSAVVDLGAAEPDIICAEKGQRAAGAPSRPAKGSPDSRPLDGRSAFDDREPRATGDHVQTIPALETRFGPETAAASMPMIVLRLNIEPLEVRGRQALRAVHRAICAAGCSQWKLSATGKGQSPAVCLGGRPGCACRRAPRQEPLLDVVAQKALEIALLRPRGPAVFASAALAFWSKNAPGLPRPFFGRLGRLVGSLDP